MIYLASPYSDPDPAVRERRFNAVCEVAAAMFRTGAMVFSPIAYSYPIARCGRDWHWETWAEFDRRMIDACDLVLVLRLDGWQESKGIAAEVEYARRTGKPVRWL